MNTTSYLKKESLFNPHGVDAKKLLHSKNVQVVHITLKSGESIIKHSAPVDVFFYILEGAGVIEIGEESKSVSKDILIESPANIPHGFTNDSDKDLRILVVKTPAPTIEQNKEALKEIINFKQ